jgi:hypothetical protein
MAVVVVSLSLLLMAPLELSSLCAMSVSSSRETKSAFVLSFFRSGVEICGLFILPGGSGGGGAGLGRIAGSISSSPISAIVS